MNAGHLTPLYIISVLITLIVSLTIHEFMHGFAAHLLGDTTAQDEGRLTLNPLAHVDPFMTLLLPAITLLVFGTPLLAAKPVPFNPYRVKFHEFGAAIVAVAGPLSNLVLAVIGALLFKISGNATMQYFWEIFAQLNVALFVFNILPIPPLDGSRVLYAFSPRPLQNLLEQLEPIGFYIIFALVLLGGFGGWLANLNQLVLNLLP